MTLRLGIIGSSEGNGHPYSWSAIINGYNKAVMEACAYSTIPRYLEQHSWPEAAIDNAQVTHIWTQDRALSKHIAKAAYIDNTVSQAEEMIGQVDAILLARDDAENHLAIARPFLLAGLPIYIDKPICLSTDELNVLYEWQQYQGQIFSCSALRYAKELILSEDDRFRLGKIRSIHATVPKDWNRYAVHIIEPLLLLMETIALKNEKLISTQIYKKDAIHTVNYQWESGFHASVSAMGDMVSPIAMRVFGDKAWQDLIFKDTFSAFQSALQSFIEGVNQKDERIPYDFLEKVVKIIELGNSTLSQSDNNKSHVLIK